MASYIAERALLDTRVTRNVRIAVDDAGYIESVTPDAIPVAGDTWLPGLTIPGMPNVHGHAFQRAMAGLAEARESENDSFWSWRARMYRLVAELTPEQVADIAAQTYAEMLCAGYTQAVEFHYLHNQVDGSPYADPLEMGRRIFDAAQRSGIGLTLLPTLYRFGDFGGAPPSAGQRRFVMDTDGYLRRLTRLSALTADLPRTRVGAALHSLRAVSLTDLADVAEGAHTIDGDMPIHIHVAEQDKEVRACREAHGTTPVRLLLDNADVDPRWCLIHATRTDAKERDDIAATGATVGLCPTTEANLGDGIFDLDGFLDAGGVFGIGSDSHVSIDPRSEVRLLEYQARLRHRARNVHASSRIPSTGARLFHAAADGGQRAAGAAVGRLAPGFRADLVVLDTDHPSLAGAKGDVILDAWIFCEHGSPVRDVAVAGDWVVTDGEHRRRAELAAAFRDSVRGLHG